ncbi:MAG: hypothetical protein CBB92_01535 [Flammeovirgaceae bacterium TMED32]|nr:MAG: hypothetical protein CBB92_01535 [Flammeovirgaceae bacterium TMED32]
MDLEKLERDLLSIGVRVDVPKKREKKIKNIKSNREKFIEWLESEIGILMERKTLDLKINVGSKGGRVKEVRSWSDIINGERQLRFKVSNYSVFLSKEYAKVNKFVLLDEDKDFNDVMKTLNYFRNEYKLMDDNDVSFYRRVKDKDTKKWKVEVLK